MSAMAPFSTSLSSSASQTVTVLLGLRAQKVASWCQLTRLPSPGILLK